MISTVFIRDDGPRGNGNYKKKLRDENCEDKELFGKYKWMVFVFEYFQDHMSKAIRYFFCESTIEGYNDGLRRHAKWHITYKNTYRFIVHISK